jgi:hypothetical protein
MWTIMVAIVLSSGGQVLDVATDNIGEFRNLNECIAKAQSLNAKQELPDKPGEPHTTLTRRAECTEDI